MPRVPVLSACSAPGVTETEHTAGKLKGPESLYENVPKLLPADKGSVQNLEAKVQGLEDYKNETAVVINKLVNKINSLTPVGLQL